VAVVDHVPNFLKGLHGAPAATSIFCFGPAPAVVLNAKPSRRK
jgi:hypothetical protein